VVMSSPRITYAPRDDTLTAVEVAALSNIYHFILRKKAAPASDPDDVKGRSKNDFHASNNSTR
jgi:hypothetical protein